MDNLIEVNDLHFSYGPHQVLKGINLTIPKGKVVGIMGSSGSGKSTLLRHFGGQLRPSRGSVKFMGQVVHELGIEELYKLRLEMGMMFQVSGLFTDLSVYDNMAFPLRENTNLPEEIIHDLVLMKLHAVGLRNAHKLMPGDRYRSRSDHLRRTLRRPGPDLAQHHREPYPQAERCARCGIRGGDL